MDHIQCDENGSHQAIEDGAQQRTGDVAAHNAAAFRRIQAINITNDGQAAFTRDREGATDCFTSHLKDQNGYRQCKEYGEDIADLLQDQRQAGFYHRGQVRANVRRHAAGEEHNADADVW